MSDLRLAGLLIGALVLLSPDASAQSWPSKPIRVVVPFAPGGAVDRIGRIVAGSLTESLGQKVIIENVAGAGGLIGLAQVARAEPDGYTLTITSFSSLAIAPAINPNVEYDPLHDFVPIAYLGGAPNTFVVSQSSGVRSLADLIERSRRDGQSIAFGSTGHGTLGHLAGAYFGLKAGVPVEHAPYKGSGMAVTDVVGGHLMLASVSLASALGNIRAGTVVPIALSSAKRMREFPDLPTFRELGFPELEVTSWFAICGPASMPKEIVKQLNREIVRVLQQPEVQKRLEQEAFEVDYMSQEALADFVKSEITRWAPIAKSILAKR